MSKVLITGVVGSLGRATKEHFLKKTTSKEGYLLG